MVNELKTAFNEIAEMRSLPEAVVLDALRSALVSAYRRDSGASTAQNIEARIDPSTGRARIFIEKEVIDEEIQSPATEVSLEKARFYEPEAQIGDTVMVQVEHTTKKFGRIAAQTAKQVILQKIREAERNALYNEFIEKEGELTTGKVQSMNSSVVTLRLHDRAEAILPRTQQIPGERYRQHEQLRVFILEVKNGNKGPQIVVSRSHRNMLRRLLEYEVPEISNGQVEIKSIAREAGYRSKVAVAALQDGIDPVGACVGMRGIRIQNIVKELHDEKIDVIEWNSDAQAFISKSLSPARVTGVYLDDDPHTGRTAIVVVPDDQLSLAIGREGQNARLAAKLTGWRIDIKSVLETAVGALENLDVPPLDTLQTSHAKLIEDVQGIIAKKAANKAIMPEEFNLLGKFANLIETRLARLREEIRQEELEQINAVRMTLPEALFDVPVDILGLSTEITEALRDFDTVGEVLLATLVDDPRLGQMLANIDGNPMSAVQTALDELMETDLDDLVEDDTEAAEPEAMLETSEAEAELVVETEPEVVEEVDEVDIEAEAELALDDVLEQDMIEAETEVTVETPINFDELVDFETEEGDVDALGQKKKSKDRRKKRRLVFDEESGEVVSQRRRKQSRRQKDWDEDVEL
ncbi:MAG: transcription termination factor NusA [Anaerolineae bacterium]|nr:transcription termination factor NusA [Anaerolineae bacterium]MDQ7035400.1 transcription termination factor NusA [Anaerolineae bacterium]